MQKLNRPHSKPTKIHNYSLNQYAETQSPNTKRIELQFVWILECMIRPRTKKEEEDWANVWHFLCQYCWWHYVRWPWSLRSAGEPLTCQPSSHNVWCVSLDTGRRVWGAGRPTFPGHSQLLCLARSLSFYFAQIVSTITAVNLSWSS